jgi:hypothetical protein
MLYLLKTAIRKKKLHFVVSLNSKNVKTLLFLLKNNIISGFSLSSYKKKTFLMVFINYCHNFGSAISGLNTNITKISYQQNMVLNLNTTRSNFVIYTPLKYSIASSSNIGKTIEPTSALKFR